MARVGDHRISKLRQRTYEILEHGPVGDQTGRNVSRLIVALIFTNIIAVALESIPDMRARFGTIFIAVEIISLVVFSSGRSIVGHHTEVASVSPCVQIWVGLFFSFPRGLIKYNPRESLIAALPFALNSEGFAV